MQHLIEQIRGANRGGLYYVALFSALALPDICGALESDDGRATQQKYTTWFDTQVAPHYNGFLDGQTCYHFRCSMLHQGSTQHPGGRYSRVLFLEPGRPGLIMHNNILGDALNIDVHIFCEDMCTAVERWLPVASAHPAFQANISRFVRRYPEGLAPYVVGTPVIA